MGSLPFPMTGAWSGIALQRPLLDVPKARLIATLEARGIGFVSDPSNADLRFERARVRGSASALAALGLTARGAGAVGAAFADARARRSITLLRASLRHRARRARRATRLVDQDALLAAPQEIALRALVAPHRLGWRRRGAVTARQARSLARVACDASRQDPHARPLPDRASGRPARHLPRDEGEAVSL